MGKSEKKRSGSEPGGRENQSRQKHAECQLSFCCFDIAFPKTQKATCPPPSLAMMTRRQLTELHLRLDWKE